MKDTIKFFDKMACKYIKKLKLSGMKEQCFYDELARFLNSWRFECTGCFQFVSCKECKDENIYCIKNAKNDGEK